MDFKSFLFVNYFQPVFPHTPGWVLHDKIRLGISRNIFQPNPDSLRARSMGDFARKVLNILDFLSKKGSSLDLCWMLVVNPGVPHFFQVPHPYHTAQHLSSQISSQVQVSQDFAAASCVLALPADRGGTPTPHHYVSGAFQQTYRPENAHRAQCTSQELTTPLSHCAYRCCFSLKFLQSFIPSINIVFMMYASTFMCSFISYLLSTVLAAGSKTNRQLMLLEHSQYKQEERHKPNVKNNIINVGIKVCIKCFGN